MITYIGLILLASAPAIATAARQASHSNSPRFAMKDASSTATNVDTVDLDRDTVTWTHFVTQRPEVSSPTNSQSTETLVVTVSDGDPSSGPWDGSVEKPILPDWTTTAFETQFVTVTAEKEVTTLLQTVIASPASTFAQLKTFGPIKPVPETIPALPPRPVTVITSEWESPDSTPRETATAPWIAGHKKERITIEWCKERNDKSTCDARDTVASVCCKWLDSIRGVS